MKKRYVLYLAILMLLLSSSLALAAGLDDLGMGSEELTLALSMDSELKIVKNSGSAMISDLMWQVSYNPIDNWQQSVLTKEVSPESTDPEALIFKWPKPEDDLYLFSLDSDVLVKNDLVRIYSDVAFPITMLDKEAEQYLLPTGNADSDNPAIVDKAAELVSGQDNLNEAVFKLFTWVSDNIEYRRTEFTQETAQSASWTLENRYGVCDELTNLFLALARSVGIPGRYVSGIAYTNIDGKDIWEPHAWAELYFPGYGWVPFDPTYREYGYIDPTHIALLYGTDSNQSSSGARWLGRDTQIIQGQLDIQVSLKERRGISSDIVSIDVEPLRENLGFGSYALIKADVRNLEGYYVYTDLSLVPGLYFTSEKPLKQAVLLKPNEEKSVFWLIRLGDDFSSRFFYTLPFVVVTSRNTTAASEAYAAAKYHSYTKQDMEELLADLEEEEQHHYSKDIGLSCEPQKAEIYTYEKQTITCTMHNIGNTPLADIKVCRDTDCTSVNLPIARSQIINFTLASEKPGGVEISIKARSHDVYKTSSVSYMVQDEPSLKIEELRYPSNVTYKGIYNLTCLLRHISLSPAYNVTLTITNRQSSYYNFSTLEADQPIILEFEGSNLGYGQNNISLYLTYHDSNGKVYTSTEKAIIELSEASLWERIDLFFVELSLWLENIFQ